MVQLFGLGRKHIPITPPSNKATRALNNPATNQSFSLKKITTTKQIWFLRERGRTMALEMASTKFSYQRLRNVGGLEEGGEQEKALSRTRSWRKFRRASSRRRSRLKIPSLRRFFRRRARLLSSSWMKVWKRLKESRSHLGDLFAGNYMFMQVTPSPVKCLDKSFMALNHPHGIPPRQPLGRLV